MIVHSLSRYIVDAAFEDLSDEAINQLKIRLLDSLGTAIGALEGGPIRSLRRMIADLIGAKQMRPPATFIKKTGLEMLMFGAADPKVFAWYI